MSLSSLNVLGAQPPQYRRVTNKTVNGNGSLAASLVVTDPAIGERVSDDPSPTAAQVDFPQFVRSSGARLLQVTRDGRPVGLFLLLPAGDDTWDVHTLMSGECRGRHAWRAARLALALVFAGPDCERLVSRCPQDNPQSLVFALCQGFHIVARRLDWWKHGRLLSSTHVELTRAMWAATHHQEATCPR